MCEYGCRHLGGESLDAASHTPAVSRKPLMPPSSCGVFDLMQVTDGYQCTSVSHLCPAQMILCAFNFLFLYRAMPNKVRDQLHAYVG